MTPDMHYATDAAVIAIGEGLTAKTLPKAQWTHAAHIAAALWLLRRLPEPKTAASPA